MFSIIVDKKIAGRKLSLGQMMNLFIASFSLARQLSECFPRNISFQENMAVPVSIAVVNRADLKWSSRILGNSSGHLKAIQSAANDNSSLLVARKISKTGGA